MSQKKTREILAKNVYNLMGALNISAAEVERRSNKGITSRMVGYILKCEKSAGIDIIEALGYAFKIQPSMLLSEMAKEDIEHLRLISSLSVEEREEVTQYANFLVQKRSKPSS